MLKIIAKFTTEENVSYGLYDTGNGEGAYIVRDEDVDQLVSRVNGPIELIAIRFEVDVRTLR